MLVFFMLGLLFLNGFPLTTCSRRIVTAHYCLNSFSGDSDEPDINVNVTTTRRDVVSLSECALRSRLLSGKTFFYSTETMECELNPYGLMNGASAGLHEYVLVIEKGISSTINFEIHVCCFHLPIVH
jgi:hypothetical protein